MPQIGKISREHAFLLDLDLSAKTVFDIGAANGILTCLFAKKVGPNGQVVAFEPNLKLYKRTLENLSLNGFRNARVINCACGSTKQIATLYYSRRIPGTGSLSQEEILRIRKLKEASSQRVSVETLDSLIRNLDLPKPDFVKIDVQGLERQVIDGMKQTIMRYRPELLVEIHKVPQDSWKTTNLQTILQILGGSGYEVIHVETGLQVSIEDFNSDEHLYARIMDD